MKTIIAGSRTITPRLALALVREAVAASGFDITEVVSGGCRGIDLAGEEWAIRNGRPVQRFPALWRQHGRSAGPRRNVQMAEYADSLIAIWDGGSRGTLNMIEEAWRRGLKVYIHRIAPRSSNKEKA